MLSSGKWLANQSAMVEGRRSLPKGKGGGFTGALLESWSKEVASFRHPSFSKPAF